MDYVILAEEIARSVYRGKDDPEVARMLNLVDQAIDRDAITGDELLECTALGELVGLDDKRRAIYCLLAGKDQICIEQGSKMRELLKVLFAEGETRANLIALVKSPLLRSRAQLIGLDRVKPGHVMKARHI